MSSTLEAVTLIYNQSRPVGTVDRNVGHPERERQKEHERERKGVDKLFGESGRCNFLIANCFLGASCGRKAAAHAIS